MPVSRGLYSAYFTYATTFSKVLPVCANGGVSNWLFNVTINDISVIYVTAWTEEVSMTYGRAPNAIDIS